MNISMTFDLDTTFLYLGNLVDRTIEYDIEVEMVLYVFSIYLGSYINRRLVNMNPVVMNRAVVYEMEQKYFDIGLNTESICRQFDAMIHHYHHQIEEVVNMLRHRKLAVRLVDCHWGQPLVNHHPRVFFFTNVDMVPGMDNQSGYL